MSKTSRKASTPKPETLSRGNVKPHSVIIDDIISDWLFEADMQHDIDHTPREKWTEEVWRFYWKHLDRPEGPPPVGGPNDRITPLGLPSECYSIEPALKKR